MGVQRRRKRAVLGSKAAKGVVLSAGTECVSAIGHQYFRALDTLINGKLAAMHRCEHDEAAHLSFRCRIAGPSLPTLRQRLRRARTRRAYRHHRSEGARRHRFVGALAARARVGEHTELVRLGAQHAVLLVPREHGGGAWHGNTNRRTAERIESPRGRILGACDERRGAACSPPAHWREALAGQGCWM